MKRARSSAQGAALIIGAALLLWAGAARATRRETGLTYDVIDPDTGLPVGQGDPWVGPVYDPGAPLEQLPWEPITMPDPAVAAYDEASLTDALLAVIRRAEVGGADDAIRYRTFYGGARFAGLQDHPVATGEMRGRRLPDWMCRNVGLQPGCVSTAAGAYQFILPTWRRLREESRRWGARLPDFSPASQDEAARRLLREIRAIEALQAGDVETAIRRAGTQWASLPGSTSGQPQRPMAQLLDWFRASLEAQG